MTFLSARKNRFSAWILFAAVALAPLPFGSTDASVVALWCIVLGVGALTASPRDLQRKHLAVLSLAALIFVTYGVVLHEQLSSDPWLPIATPSPLWAEAGRALNIPLQPTASIARNQPFYALGRPLAALVTVICAFIVCGSQARSRQLLQVTAWSGAVYALFGFAFLLIDPTKILWREKQAYLPYLTSTFINRNTAAVYFGCCAILWLLFLSETLHKRTVGEIQERVSWKFRIIHPISEIPRDVVIPLSMLLICLLAMFATGSRAGVVISLVGAVLAFTLFFRRVLAPRSGKVTVFAVSAFVALVLLQVLGTSVNNRFDTQSFSDGMRLDTYRSTLRTVGDYPWLGTGIGTFPWSFPAYRITGSTMWGTVDRSHNTLLEIASEAGIPAASIVFAVWMAALSTLIRGVLIRRRNQIVPIAAFAVAIVALIHSLIDFSLQVLGFAIPVFAILGAGLAQSFRTK